MLLLLLLLLLVLLILILILMLLFMFMLMLLILILILLILILQILILILILMLGLGLILGLLCFALEQRFSLRFLSQRGTWAGHCHCHQRTWWNICVCAWVPESGNGVVPFLEWIRSTRRVCVCVCGSVCVQTVVAMGRKHGSVGTGKRIVYETRIVRVGRPQALAQRRGHHGVCCGLWVVCCGLSIVGCLLWVVGCGLSVVGCGLSVVGCLLWVVVVGCCSCF